MKSRLTRIVTFSQNIRSCVLPHAARRFRLVTTGNGVANRSGRGKLLVHHIRLPLFLSLQNSKVIGKINCLGIYIEIELIPLYDRGTPTLELTSRTYYTKDLS